MARAARSRRSAPIPRDRWADRRTCAPSSASVRRPGTPSGPPVDAALAREELRVDEVPPQRGVVLIQGPDDRVDLILAVVTLTVEPRRQMREQPRAHVLPG